MKPFLKWAGGKRWLTKSHPDLLLRTYTRYVEPFLGSGAVFFHLEPTNSLLADANNELVQVYHSLQQRPDLVLRYLKEMRHLHSEKYYYAIRATRPLSPYRRAARFIYLNRTCWNGLYRVNKSGAFNVPKGTKNTVIFDDDDFVAVSKLLKSAVILCQDFSLTLQSCGEGDFVFIDPPYAHPKQGHGFTKYTSGDFSWDDQVRLARDVQQAVSRGASVLMTNHHCIEIEELYEGFGVYSFKERSQIISGNGKSRGKRHECVIAA